MDDCRHGHSLEAEFVRWPIAAIRASGWDGVVVPTFRPDDVVDPDRPDFSANLDRLADLTGRDTSSWAGYLDAIRERRRAFLDAGATATDHGPPTARTADLDPQTAARLFVRVRATTARREMPIAADSSTRPAGRGRSAPATTDTV